MLLTRAGEEWSVLVPEGRPWLDGEEPVDRVLTGWATALAVGAPWPVLALWWDADRAGYTLASGFRRPVGYVWLANGTPVGEDEAMRTFAARLGLDPVLDMQSLDRLTRPDSAADARARLRGLIAVLARRGRGPARRTRPGRTRRPPPGGRPRPAGRLPVEWAGWPEAVPRGIRRRRGRRLGPWMPWAGPGPGPDRGGPAPPAWAYGAGAAAGSRRARCSWPTARWVWRTTSPARSD